jgi:hypothetical protein
MVLMVLFLYVYMRGFQQLCRWICYRLYYEPIGSHLQLPYIIALADLRCRQDPTTT